MPCYSPLQAIQTVEGDVRFFARGSVGKSRAAADNVLRELSLPCGQCIGCRLERSRQWAVRCMHEASLHDSNCFITLTFDDDYDSGYADGNGNGNGYFNGYFNGYVNG